jgi:hypothetical protein
MKYCFVVLPTILAAVVTLAQNASKSSVPAYHPAPPKAGNKLPPILTEKELAQKGFNLPVQKNAYKAAARESSIIYQMPCYCYCDRGHGHTSLRSCFEGTHAAVCGTCLQEAFYAERQSKRGWSIKMIRDGIERGDFKMIDLRKASPTK